MRLMFNALGSPRFSNHPLEVKIQQERHHLFMKEVGSRMAATVVMAMIVGGLFIDSAPSRHLWIWFGLTLFVSINSWWIIRCYNLQQAEQAQKPPMEDKKLLAQVKRWHLINLYLALIWGVQWSLAPTLFFPDASMVQLFTLMLLVVINSSMPSVTMGVYPDLYLAFLTPVLAAFGWGMAGIDFGDSQLHKWLAPITWIALVGYSVMIFRTQIDAIRLRLELEESKKEVERANHAKTRFLAAASHDIRQPLQAASMYWSALEAPEDAHQLRMFQRMGSSLTAANDMLSRLLDLSRVDAGSTQPVMAAVDMRELLHELEVLFHPKAEQKGLRLTLVCPGHPLALCDRHMMVQILRNLLANAIQYTSKGSVEVHVWREPQTLKLAVCDTGIGIPAHQQREVFEEFVQLNNPARQRRKGLGLGLSIVSRLCQVQQIPLELNSTPDQGSRFELQLLAATEADLPAPKRPSTKRSLSGLKVLIIDDHEDVLDALSAQLVSQDCDVWIASSPDSLRLQLQQPACRPDIVLTDDRLQDGVRANDVMNMIHTRSDIQAQMVVITGNTDPARLAELDLLGCPILNKPVTAEELTECLLDLISK